MGIYVNPDNIDFQEALNSEIYVDKTELIKHTNVANGTKQENVLLKNLWGQLFGSVVLRH